MIRGPSGARPASSSTSISTRGDCSSPRTVVPVYDPSGVTVRLAWEVLSQMLYAHARAHLGA
jgi:hypothetical protein